jgi:hypothetical protein
MNEKLRLSYSKVRTYTECPKKYYFHYVEKLREKTKSGALLFGTAFDKAVEAVLKDRNANEYEVFDRYWEAQDINGVVENLYGNPKVVYAKADFDAEILDHHDIMALEKHATDLFGEFTAESMNVAAIYADSLSRKENRASTPEDLRFMSMCNWRSMKRKGHLMLKANREKVLHKIKEVLSVQPTLILENGDDSFVGYADLDCIWEDGQPTIIDYKTSAIEYARDSAATSPQLASYAFAKGYTRAGFVVFRKQIMKNRKKVCSVCDFEGTGGKHKTCANEVTKHADGGETKVRCGGAWIESIEPEVNVQIIVDTISPQVEKIVIDNYQDVATMIKVGVYPRNFNSCNQGYGPCPYKRYCYKGDCSDLEKANGSS